MKMPSRWSGRAAALALVSLIATLAGACAQSPEVKKQTAVERAEEHLKNRKANEAVIELRNALQIDRDFVPALHALGRAYLAKSWYTDAARELERANRLAPDSLAIAGDYSRALLESGQFAEAETQAKRILDREPGNATGLYVQAATLLNQRRLPEATALLDRAVSGGAAMPELQSLRADALASSGRVDEAEAAYRAALASNSNDLRSLVGLATIAVQRNRNAEAAELFAKAKTVRPMDARARAGAAALKERAGKLQEAIVELETMEPRSRPLWVTLTLADYYIRANRPGDAINGLSPIVSRFPAFIPARQLLGVAYLAKGDAGRAIGELETVARATPGNTMATYQLGGAYLAHGRAKDALARFDSVAKQLGGTPQLHIQRGRALLVLGQLDPAAQEAATAQRIAPQEAAGYLLMGQIRTQQGDLKAAREMFAKAAQVDATYAPAHLALGRLNIAENDVDAALREFDAAVRADPRSLAAARTKAVALVQQKRIKEAIEFVQDAAKADPRNPGFHGLLAALYTRDAQWGRAADAYRKALEIDPKAIGPSLGLARLATAQGKDEEALTHLQGILKHQPGQPAAVLISAGLTSKAGRYPQAISILETGLAASPRQAAFERMLAELYVRTGRFDDAIKLASQQIADKKSPLVYLIRGRAHLARQDPSAALKDFNSAIQLDPKAADPQYFKGRALVGLGLQAEAQTAYKEALRLDARHLPARTGLAALTGDKPDAAELKAQVTGLKAAVAKDPGNVALRDSLARALMRSGDVAAAQSELKALLDRAPGDPESNMLMAQILARQNKPDEAAGHLRAALRGNPSHVEANLGLARYLDSKGRREEAIPLFETALRTNSKRLDVKLRLAGLYAQTNRTADALRLADELRSAIPEDPGPELLRGWVLLGQGNPKVAREAFEAALARRPGLPDAHRGLGRALEETGLTEAAIDHYRKAIAGNPKDAVSLNNLAWVLGEVKKRPDEALPLAVRAEQLAPSSAHVLDTLGWIHYRRGAYADAEKILARAVARAPGNASIQFHLGMTYSRLGKKPEAVSALRRAAQLDAKLAQNEQIDRIIREIGG